MTRIVCTIGPASQHTDILRAMAEAGMAVARLNCSHGNHEEQKLQIENIQSLRKDGLKVGIMLDLEGWRIRIGIVPGGAMELYAGQELILSALEISPGRKGQAVIPFDYTGDLSDVRPGSKIFIDDGNIELSAVSGYASAVCARVVVPGLLKSRKGVNMPDFHSVFTGLSKKDETDIDFGVRQGVDWIAQSFVRSREDVQLVRDRAGRHPCQILAKIENREGIEGIEEILSAADGIMVARGDMGVSIPIYQVPVMQKKLIHLCSRKKKIDITATQMLESMTIHPRPTRAEVSDVANAVIDGSDYVMLSGETAVGRYPVQTVQMMKKIIEYTERHYKKNDL